MPIQKRKHRHTFPFEDAGSAPDEWLKYDLPLLCDAVREEPAEDPWESRGKILRGDSTTERRRLRLKESRLSVRGNVRDESGASQP